MVDLEGNYESEMEVDHDSDTTGSKSHDESEQDGIYKFIG